MQRWQAETAAGQAGEQYRDHVDGRDHPAADPSPAKPPLVRLVVERQIRRRGQPPTIGENKQLFA